MEAEVNLLVINPNSSTNVTETIRDAIGLRSDIHLGYYTAPPTAPKEINGDETAAQSEASVLEDLEKNRALFDGFEVLLVCCFSDHPLVYSLPKLTGKPVVGMMQATLAYTILTPTLEKLIILTSVRSWEPLLDKALSRFMGTGSFPSGKFEKTRALEVGVVDLAQSFETVCQRVESILGEYKGSVNAVILGCAGLTGMGAQLQKCFPGIEFIDGIITGVEFLSSIARQKRALNRT